MSGWGIVHQIREGDLQGRIPSRHIPPLQDLTQVASDVYGACSLTSGDRADRHTSSHHPCIRLNLPNQHTCLVYVRLALADGRASLRGHLTSFEQTIDVHTGFKAPAIRASEEHDRGAIDAVHFAASALQSLRCKWWWGTGREKARRECEKAQSLHGDTSDLVGCDSMGTRLSFWRFLLAY
jgi:hypothetical protein